MDKKVKVLVVDDDTNFCNTLSKILVKKGYETQCTESGFAAIRVADEGNAVDGKGLGQGRRHSMLNRPTARECAPGCSWPLPGAVQTGSRPLAPPAARARPDHAAKPAPAHRE